MFEDLEARLRALETTLTRSGRALRDLQAANAALDRDTRQLRQDMAVTERDLEAEAHALRQIATALAALSRAPGAGPPPLTEENGGAPERP